MTEQLSINEIFYSIQGEGSYSGYPCIFVRLMGCNLRCTWCDTEYSFYEGKKLTYEEIYDIIEGYPQCKMVEFTGGEPLLQKNIYPFFDVLYRQGYQILLETSGSINIEFVPSYVHIVMDLKAPDSKESEANHYDNIYRLKPTDDLKIVVASVDDMQWAYDICHEYSISNVLNKPVILQPAFGIISAEEVGEFIKAIEYPFRLGLQLHKYIYSATARGV